MPFVVKAHIDDVMLSAKAGTAKEALQMRSSGMSLKD
jgi:hypothetical protein